MAAIKAKVVIISFRIKFYFMNNLMSMYGRYGHYKTVQTVLFLCKIIFLFGLVFQ